MTEERDPLDRLMGNIDPARTDPAAPLTERDIALLERVTRTDPQQHAVTRSSRVRPTFALAASFIAFFVIAAAAFVLWPSNPTMSAATPRLLEAAHIDGKASAMLSSIGETLQEHTSRSTNEAVRYQFWALEFSEDEPPQSVEPQEVVVTTDRQGRSILEARALGSFDTEGNPVDTEGARKPGEVVNRMEFGPGEFPYLYTDPNGVTDWAEYLRAGAGLEPDASAGEYFDAVGDLMNERKLTLEQQAGIVSMLAKLPGIKVDGLVTDRLGRDGVSFSTTTREPGEVRDVLVVSAEAGILSYENVYIGSSRTDLQAPAVIEYYAWH